MGNRGRDEGWARVGRTGGGEGRGPLGAGVITAWELIVDKNYVYVYV